MANNPIYIWVKTPKDLSRVLVEKILYCSKKGDNVEVYSTDCPCVTVVHTLTEMETILPQSKFCRCHKSYVVNLGMVTNYVEKVPEAILVEGSPVPVSRKKKQEFYNKLMRLDDTENTTE